MASTQTFDQRSYTLSFAGETKEDVINKLNEYLKETPRLRSWYPEEIKNEPYLGRDWHSLSVIFTRYSDVVRNADGTAGLSE